MAEDALRVSQSEQPRLFEQIEDALYRGEGEVEIGGKLFEIVGSQLTPGVDAVFILVEV